MEERLKLFLAMEGLSPSQFADKLGIQRSGVSHLLAGRNKPSFEFISKMLLAYPKLNPDWLILGTGKAYRDFGASEDLPDETAKNIESLLQSPDLPEVSPKENFINNTEPDLFFKEERPANEGQAPYSAEKSASSASPLPESHADANAQRDTVQAPKPEPVMHIKQPDYAPENRVKPHPAAPAPAKRIAQITILYTDGTFEVR